MVQGRGNLYSWASSFASHVAVVIATCLCMASRTAMVGKSRDRIVRRRADIGVGIRSTREKAIKSADARSSLRALRKGRQLLDIRGVVLHDQHRLQGLHDVLEAVHRGEGLGAVGVEGGHVV